VSNTVKPRSPKERGKGKKRGERGGERGREEEESWGLKKFGGRGFSVSGREITGSPRNVTTFFLDFSKSLRFLVLILLLYSFLFCPWSNFEYFFSLVGTVTMNICRAQT
jgi:hypothetical protein